MERLKYHTKINKFSVKKCDVQKLLLRLNPFVGAIAPARQRLLYCLFSQIADLAEIIYCHFGQNLQTIYFAKK
jgi:hypothetical protein